MFRSQNNGELSILLWRNWKPLYDYPATYSALNKHSIGGTCSQLLWHAKNLVRMGHRVQVLGATTKNVVEDNVDFVGCSNRFDQEQVISSGRIQKPDVIFLEGASGAANWFKSVFPSSEIIHIGQNIDRYGFREAFRLESAIDTFAFVSPGHLAEYCVRFPRLRHKFFLIRNVVPWETLYNRVVPKPVEDHILWVGAWTKKGLRSWAETLQKILARYPSYRWTLCGPVHGAHVGDMPSYIFSGIRFPEGKVSVKSLPLVDLAQEISTARIVLVSLGHETACISALDAHAMGRPVISGNDIVFKYNNIEGTGIRVTTEQERYDALVILISKPELCARMGAIGRDLVLSNYTEHNQRNDISIILEYLKIKDSLGKISGNSPANAWKESLADFKEKIKRKVLSIKTGLF